MGPGSRSARIPQQLNVSGRSAPLGRDDNLVLRETYLIALSFAFSRSWLVAAPPTNSMPMPSSW